MPLIVALGQNPRPPQVAQAPIFNFTPRERDLPTHYAAFNRAAFLLAAQWGFHYPISDDMAHFGHPVTQSGPLAYNVHFYALPHLKHRIILKHLSPNPDFLVRNAVQRIALYDDARHRQHMVVLQVLFASPAPS
jgi:hypothetical protein